jgi:predicted dehydrogenase
VINWADAIVIATPTSRHYADIILCHPSKPLFVEKPIVCTRDQLSIPTVNNIRMVGYNLRFHSCVKKAREWLGTGLIGKPLWARFTCAQYNDKPAYLRDGVILNWSHEIDLALYLLGNARLDAASISHNVREDMADLVLQHGNTLCRTSIHLDYLTKWERRGFVIVGDNGSLEADLVSRQIFHRDNNGRFIHTHYGRDTFDGNYLSEAKAFLDRLDGKETIGCTAAEAIEIIRICLEAKEFVSGNTGALEWNQN